MMDPERLRTRLMIAAQRFANEVADAVIEATGVPEKVAEEKPRRRAPQRAPRVVDGPTNADARAAAADALAKVGIR
jgi:hypothetical protein